MLQDGEISRQLADSANWVDRPSREHLMRLFMRGPSAADA
jgi:hypothetical protein